MLITPYGGITKGNYRCLPNLYPYFARNCTYNQEYQEALSYLLQAVRRANAADVAWERDIYSRVVAEMFAFKVHKDNFRPKCGTA